MALENLTLDGLDLQAGVYSITAMKFTPAKKRPEWAEAVDGDGALLIRDPYSDNSQWDLTVEVRAASRDAGHTAAGLITDKLEEADRTVLGIPLVWTPADSTKALTFYVLTGEISEVPITIESGYFASPPVLAVSLSLTCRPFGYGAEVTVTSASGAGPLQIFSIAGVTGDVPAEGRLIVTDTATQSRDFCCWGLEQRFQAGADLLLTTPDLTITGFAGTSTTRAGSVSTNIYRGTLTTSPVAVCGTGNQPHIGTYRVYARLWATGLGVRARLTYREGDGPLKSLNWETPPAEDAWVELDLGVVTIPPKLLGTQRWQAQVEAYTDTPGDTLDVDLLEAIPAGEGYGRARRTLQFETSTTFSARDEFDQTAGVLVAKVAPTGGTWAGAGDADDFSVETTGHTAQRTAVSDTTDVGHYGVLGATNYTNIIVQTDVKTSDAAGSWLGGVIARYSSTTSFLRAFIQQNGGELQVRLQKNTGSLVQIAANVDINAPVVAGQWYSIRLSVDAAGRYRVWVWETGGAPGGPVISGLDSDLATGGSLATGKPGLYDEYRAAGPATRNYDNFMAFVPVADAVCFSGRSIEFRSDDTQRYDSTGVYAGSPKEYRGAPFFIPPAGDEGRTSRVAVMMRRNDIATTSEANVTDAQSIEVRYTPRYSYLPR